MKWLFHLKSCIRFILFDKIRVTWYDGPTHSFKAQIKYESNRKNKQNQISLTVNRFYVDFDAIAPWEKKAREKNF